MKLTYIISISLALFFSNVLYAQENPPEVKKDQKIEVLHTPPDALRLPDQGQDLTIELFLPKDAKNLSLILNPLVTRDGVLLNLPSIEPGFDSAGKIKYTFSIPSPKQELWYQFLFDDKVGHAFGSNVYRVSRSCINSLDNGIASNESTIEIVNKVKKLENINSLLTKAQSIAQLIAQELDDGGSK